MGPLSFLLIISVFLFPITSLCPLLSSLSCGSAWSDGQGRGLMGLGPIGLFDGRGWWRWWFVVGDCGLMGMDSGPTVQWSWWRFGVGRGSPIYWVCVCVMGFGSPIWFCFLWFLIHRSAGGGDGGFFFFFFLLWFVVMVLVRRGSWVTDPTFVCVWWVLVHRSSFGSCGFWFGVMGLLVGFGGFFSFENTNE